MKTLLWSLLCCALGSATPATENWDNADVTPLTALNTPAMEYLPSLSEEDKTLFFVSDRPTTVRAFQKGGSPGDVPDNSQNVWMARRASDNSYSDQILAHDNFNRASVSDGSVSRGITPLTYIFASGDTRESLGETDLYFQKVKRPDAKTVVVETENIGDKVNSPYRDETPALAPDGTLYFSSNRPGGRGGSDIWLCRYDRTTGTWQKAENAGPAINTADDELAPAVSPDGRSLVFASKGQRPSLGGYDLFISTLADGKATEPINLGKKINSAGSEVGACFSKSGDALYFSSDISSNFDLYVARLR